MVGALLSLIPSIVGLLGSNKAHDQYSAVLDNLNKNQKLPDAALTAQQEYSGDRTLGYRHLSTMERRVKNQAPETVERAKDFLTGGGAMDLIERAGVRTNQGLQQLYEGDDALKQQHADVYKAFMGTTMAAYQNKLQDDKNQLSIASGYNKVDKAAVQTKTMGGVGNMLAGIMDKDISSLIAGLSKNETPTTKQLDPKTSTKATFEDNPYDTSSTASPPTFRPTPVFSSSPDNIQNVNKVDKSQMAGMNLTEQDALMAWLMANYTKK